MKKLFVAVTLTLALAATAAAQDRPAAGQLTDYTFTDADEVTGGRAEASGIRAEVRTRSTRRSLIRPRTHFVPEMLKSVERL